MPELPYYSHTDAKGDTLEIRKSPGTNPEYGFPEIRVTPPRSSGYREWWYGPRGEEAIDVARVFLDAAGLTDHVILTERDVSVRESFAAANMRKRASELAYNDLPTEYDTTVAESIRALPLLADGDTECACNFVDVEGPSADCPVHGEDVARLRNTSPPTALTLAVRDERIHELEMEMGRLRHEIAGQIFADEQECQEAAAEDPTNAWMQGRLVGLQRARDIATEGAPAAENDEVHYDLAWNPTGPGDDLTLCESIFVGTTGTEHACAQPTGHTTLHRNIPGTVCWHNEAGDCAFDTDLAGRVAHLEATQDDEADSLVVTRGAVKSALGRIADLEEALEEATGLMEDYQADQAAIRGRLDAVEAQPKSAVHITVTAPALTEETNG